MKFVVFTLISLVLSVGYAGDLKSKFVVIDSGFSPFLSTPRTLKALCKSGHYDYTREKAQIGLDTIGHGSYVSNLIVENSRRDDTCLVVMKINVYDVDTLNSQLVRAINRSSKLGAVAVNISLGVPKINHKLKRAFRRAGKKGMKTFASSGNEGKKLNQICDTFPACYAETVPNLYTVGSKDRSGLPETYSNMGSKVHIFEYGTIPGIGRGTSFASPRALARYLREL